MRKVLLLLLSVCVVCLSGIELRAAGEKNSKQKAREIARETAKVMNQYRPVIERGLRYLAKQQHGDGHWEASGKQHSIAMTALASIALMCEGSTPRQGRFAKQLQKSVTYLMKRSQPNGLIGDPQDPFDRHRYMYGHGFSLMYLAQVYGEEEDKDRREKLRKVLEKAVDFTCKAQTSRGGWGYVSSRDGNGFDEGSVTITQVQALRAAKNAGITVPKKNIEMAKEYLKKCTYPERGAVQDKDPRKRAAGVIYSLSSGGGGSPRPALTAAGIACMFNAGEYDNELAIQWLNYCQKRIPIGSTVSRFGHFEYTHLYFAQVMYVLGEDRHAKMRPDLPEKDLMKWSDYRKSMFAHLKSRQSSNGSWPGSYGAVYQTSIFLTIMQLDKANLPIYQR